MEHFLNFIVLVFFFFKFVYTIFAIFSRVRAPCFNKACASRLDPYRPLRFSVPLALNNYAATQQAT